MNHNWQDFNGELEGCNCPECYEIQVCLNCGAVKKEFKEDKFGIHIRIYYSLSHYENNKSLPVKDNTLTCNEIMLKSVL